jgi:hypothetical protein
MSAGPTDGFDVDRNFFTRVKSSTAVSAEKSLLHAAAAVDPGITQSTGHRNLGGRFLEAASAPNPRRRLPLILVMSC